MTHALSTCISSSLLSSSLSPILSSFRFCPSHVPPIMDYPYVVLISFFFVFPMFCSFRFVVFPFPWIGWICGVQKLLDTLMNLLKLRRHFDANLKNFLDSLMSHQTLTARHNQFLISNWISPVSFSPARRASELPLRSGLPPPLDTLAGLSQVHNAKVMAQHSIPRSAPAMDGCHECHRESRGDRVTSHDGTCTDASTWHVQFPFKPVMTGARWCYVRCYLRTGTVHLL